MSLHFNFGNVINSYVNAVFPHSGAVGEKDDSADPDHEQPLAQDLPLRHKITYSLFTAATLALLITLCLITVNIKAVFMTNKSLNYAIREIVSPNEAGFKHLVEKIHKSHGELKLDEPSDAFGSESAVKRYAVPLAHKEHLTSIDKLKSRLDIAIWIQFGLIPSLYRRLNTFNRWVTDTALITFKGRDKAFRYEVPNEVLTTSKLLVHADPAVESRTKSGDGHNIFYSYSFNDKLGVNFEMVHGKNMEEIMSGLMQGTGYLAAEPYFPLNSIISDSKIDEISVDFLTHNVLSDVIASVNVNFSFRNVDHKVNGEEVSETKVEGKVTVSSYRISTVLFPLFLDGVLFVVLIASFIYTVVLYRMHPKSFFFFDYLFELTFKVSVFLSLIFFNTIVLFANYKLPRVTNMDCKSAFCLADLVLGYNNVKLDKDRLLSFGFETLKRNIRISVVVFGFLCFFTMVSVMSSLISTWLVINKNKQLSLVYKKYYYHLKMPLLSLVVGIGISILLIAVFNSSVSHMFKSSVQSILHNALALLNLILGISNDATLRYIDNYSIMYSIVFVMLLFIAFYLAVILITSLLLMFDDNEKTLNFRLRPISWRYDYYRVAAFLRSVSLKYKRFKDCLSMIVFRSKTRSSDYTQVEVKSDPATSDDLEDEISDLKPKFKFSFLSLFKAITYLAMAGCMCGFIYFENKYLKVSRVIADTVEEQLFRESHRWNFELKLYDMKYSDLVSDFDFKPKNHVINAVVTSTLPKAKIRTYPDLYDWLNDGSIKSLFRQIETADREHLPQNHSSVVGINSRYYLYPREKPVLFSLSFLMRPPKDLVPGLKKVLFHNRYYQLLTFDNGSYGFKSLMQTTNGLIPDTVDKVVLDFILVDSKSENKIYNGQVKFYIERSGMMAHEVKVRSVFGFFLPSDKKRIFLFILLGCSSLFLILLLGIMGRDIFKFQRGFKMYYPRSGVLHMVMMYFFNDVKRFFDLLVLCFVISLICLYAAIFIYHRIITKHFDSFEDLFYRYYYQSLSRRIFYIHSSVALMLAGILLFGLILKNQTVRHYLYVGISVFYQMKYLYTNIVFYFLVITFTFLFFYYFISKDYFTDFIKGNKFFKRCVRLILHDHQFFGDFKDSSLSELLFYPLCLTFKIWMMNIIFYHLWSVWPRPGYAKTGVTSEESDLIDTPDEIEKKFKHSELEVTTIAQNQLDFLPKELKAKAADETKQLYNRFKEFNKNYNRSGKNKLRFMEQLHDDLGDEMNDLLDISNKLEFKVGIISKQTEILQSKSYKDLEEQISILEESLADKREELNTVFAEYAAKSK